MPKPSLNLQSPVSASQVPALFDLLVPEGDWEAKTPVSPSEGSGGGLAAWLWVPALPVWDVGSWARGLTFLTCVLSARWGVNTHSQWWDRTMVSCAEGHEPLGARCTTVPWK